jgi:hypothetical protein
MKKLLLNLGLAIIIAFTLNACSPQFWDAVTDAAVISNAILDDIVVSYYVPGYYFYDGYYHRNSYEYNHRYDGYQRKHYKR